MPQQAGKISEGSSCSRSGAFGVSSSCGCRGGDNGLNVLTLGLSEAVRTWPKVIIIRLKSGCRMNSGWMICAVIVQMCYPFSPIPFIYKSYPLLSMFCPLPSTVLLRVVSGGRGCRHGSSRRGRTLGNTKCAQRKYVDLPLSIIVDLDSLSTPSSIMV